MFARTFVMTAVIVLTMLFVAGPASASGGATTANGWYEEEEIYYLLGGVEEGVTERGENDLYLIGGDRRSPALTGS